MKKSTLSPWPAHRYFQNGERYFENSEERDRGYNYYELMRNLTCFVNGSKLFVNHCIHVFKWVVQ